MTFTFKLQQPDGTPAEPPSITVAVPNMRRGDTIPVDRDRVLRVVGSVAGTEPHDDDVLIVELATSEEDAA